jgi:hypothetical protein
MTISLSSPDSDSDEDSSPANSLDVGELSLAALMTVDQRTTPYLGREQDRT